MPQDLTLTVKREFAAFKSVTPAVDRFLQENQASAETSYKVKLVIEEIILNLIRHAMNPASDEIQIHLAAEQDALRIVIEDDSNPFDPHASTSPKRDAPLSKWGIGGMGLHLVRSMVDRLDYERRGGKNRLEAQIVAWSNKREST
jgi:serine/threonine-protein kinase RsbW